MCCDGSVSTATLTLLCAQVGEVLKNTSSPKLHILYAKAREADGSFAEAAHSFEIARELESAIRIHLDNLNDPDEAVRIVQVGPAPSLCSM